MNRLHNMTNPHQGKYKKVLCVCSAGLLRSPTAAVVLSQPPFDFNTRAAGIEESYALVPVDTVLVNWADEIVCMTNAHARQLELAYPEAVEKTVLVLSIPDSYAYRDPELMKLIAERYTTCAR
jgi:predicted protein tyrosine phosphatase